MVKIAPFRGVIYNNDEIKDHGGLLVAPPYDVLSEQQRQNCLNLHPHNILNIDYGPVLPDDDQKYSWHKRSGELLKKWLDEGVLTRLDKPAIFHVETHCKNPQKDGIIVRNGIVCLMKLEEFSPASQVRPHEKTFSSHKEERLGLMKATGANISQVFGFFPDENRLAIEKMTSVTNNNDPDFNFTDYRGFGHKMWINQNEQSIDEIKNILNDVRVYIADGHHRYETALNYCRWLKETKGNAPASAEYVMIYLCPMSDPGLVIYPTHRLLNQKDIHPDEMLNKLSHFFKISGKTFDSDNEEIIRSRFLSKLKKQKNSFGLYFANRKTYYVIKLLESAKQEAALLSEPKELAALDTVVLNNIVFKEALGLTEENMDNPDIISYVSNLKSAIQMIDDKECSVAFILNPSTVEDILRVTEKGFIMSRKSTFFYPKVTTGLVMNIID